MKTSEPTESKSKGSTPSKPLVGAIMLGTLLNPLNSSMIALALTSLELFFGIGVTTASWLISGFYLAASVGQPLMGRLSDQFGPRRIFCIGLVIVGLASVAAPFAPSFGWLVALRVVQALGTSAAFPAGLAIIRARSGDPTGRPPANALGALAIAASISSALGPVVGGFAISLAGWPAIFLVNVPIILAGFVMALRFIPPDTPVKERSTDGHGSLDSKLRGVLGTIDIPGMLLFSAMLVCLLGFLLSLSSQPLWPLLPAAIVATASVIVYERQRAEPFLDVRMLATNLRLIGVYAQYAAVNVVFYSVFFSLPIWFEQARHYNPEHAGLLMLPIAGIGIIATPVAARLINLYGPKPALVIGASMLTTGSALLLIFNASTPVPVILLVGAVLGVPNAFNNLGLQAALYKAVSPEQTGAAGGLFQTFRYLGAILSTTLLGIIFNQKVTSSGLHAIAISVAILSVLIVTVSVLTPGESRRG